MMGDDKSDDAELHTGGTLHLKAAESALVLKWAVSLGSQYLGDEQLGEDLLSGARGLLKFMMVLHNVGFVPSAEQCAYLFNLVKSAEVDLITAGVADIPKFHFSLHLADRIGWGGFLPYW